MLSEAIHTGCEDGHSRAKPSRCHEGPCSRPTSAPDNVLLLGLQAALSGWGADFLKQNKKSEAKANAAVAAAIEEQKGTTKGRLSPQEQSFSLNLKECAGLGLLLCEQG